MHFPKKNKFLFSRFGFNVLSVGKILCYVYSTKCISISITGSLFVFNLIFILQPLSHKSGAWFFNTKNPGEWSLVCHNSEISSIKILSEIQDQTMANSSFIVG